MKDINDKYKAVLGDKLGQFREEPPADMFERIEQTLAASGAVGSPQAEKAKVVVPLWRRPIFKGAVAMLVAASVALAIVLNLDDKVEQLAVAEVEDVMVAQEIAPVEEQASEEIPSVDPVQQIMPQRGAGKGGEMVAMVALNEAEVHPVLAETKEEAAETTTTKKKREKATVTSSQRSERRSREELEQYWREMLAEEPRERGVAHPVQIALHTANVGINRGDVNINNLANSQMLVREQHELGGGSYMGPMMAQPMKTNLEHSMPVTLGVTVSYSLTDWLSVDSGLLYTSLSSKGESSGAASNYLCSRSMDYLGIPVALSLYVAEFDRLSLYGRVGVTGELCVRSRDRFYLDGKLNREENLENLNTTSLSFDAAAGVNYALVGGLGLFGEVGCSYWKSPEGYPENYRTLHPLSLTTRIGVRFTFN